MGRVECRDFAANPNATLRSKFYLRICIVNHHTTDADLDRVVPEVLAAAKNVLPTYHSGPLDELPMDPAKRNQVQVSSMRT